MHSSLLNTSDSPDLKISIVFFLFFVHLPKPPRTPKPPSIDRLPRIGPVTLPQDPGEASLKGQVSVKNTKGEPVACVALDIEARKTPDFAFLGGFSMGHSHHSPEKKTKWDLVFTDFQ